MHRDLQRLIEGSVIFAKYIKPEVERAIAADYGQIFVMAPAPEHISPDDEARVRSLGFTWSSHQGWYFGA